MPVEALCYGPLLTPFRLKGGRELYFRGWLCTFHTTPSFKLQAIQVIRPARSDQRL